MKNIFFPQNRFAFAVSVSTVVNPFLCVKIWLLCAPSNTPQHHTPDEYIIVVVIILFPTRKTICTLKRRKRFCTDLPSLYCIRNTSFHLVAIIRFTRTTRQYYFHYCFRFSSHSSPFVSLDVRNKIKNIYVRKCNAKVSVPTMCLFFYTTVVNRHVFYT